MKRVLVAVVFAVAVFLLSACASSYQPKAQSDNAGASFKADSYVPVDDSIYLVKGEVAADVGSLTRQTAPAYGSGVAVDGFGSAYYRGPTVDGKSFVRLFVYSISPSVDTVQPGTVEIVKVTDTKATALLPGDVITLKCRRQYEAVAPITSFETLNVDKYATWELDYCRLATGTVEIK